MIEWWTGFGGYVMSFESGVVPEDWRSVMIVPLCKSKGERIECRN